MECHDRLEILLDLTTLDWILPEMTKSMISSIGRLGILLDGNTLDCIFPEKRGKVHVVSLAGLRFQQQKNYLPDIQTKFC